MSRAAALLAVALALPAAAGPVPGRIVFVGTDHQLYLVGAEGGEARPLTRGEEPGRMTRAPFRWFAASAGPAQGPVEGPIRFSHPSWAPDGKRLLVHGSRMSGEAVAGAGVYRLQVDRPGVITPVYEDARRAPIYTFWDPTGERAAILVSAEDGLALGLVDVADGRMRSVASGIPFYFDWRADGRAIAAHVGGSIRDNPGAFLGRIELDGSSDEEPRLDRLADRPAAFRAPAWSPDGRRLAWASFAEEDGAATLFVEEGAQKRSLGGVSSRLVFGWTPDGRSLAVAEAGAPAGSLFAGINLVDVADGRREPLYAGPVAGFFWAPDGKRLMIAAPDFDTGEWRWLLLERQSRQAREVARFLPNPELQMLLLHFDQYALSHRLWAPDSRHFVFAAYPAGAAGPVESMVTVIDTAAGGSKTVGEGRAAFWSPR